ncbi:hypothetical protein HYH02_008221 [Chlamydomonas schloesseri]|uniref:Protein kinase domain-containing protein n=1 Tax=Chlamydomonas schloesseri TaxID=2026947 RepID=A0A835WFT2_9CHLO|nr:hypothetical protein HYH02_008221 [Chlamydomonas schloesseri]|eukprot:KAG2446650.1 hypothetical protein HYH02_008221 [Chlamydomonas schloesseri]
MEPGPVNVSRNVTVQATPELLAAGTRVDLDFKGQIWGALAVVGPLLNIFRQSVGGCVALVNCVIIRRAGLPVDAAVVNILATSRLAGAVGPQQAYKVSNLTYNTTRSSLAFQGLYFGGYNFASFNTYYIPEHVVDPACLKTRPGDECVTALLRDLDAHEAARQAATAPSDSGGLSTTDTIVVAVVVPVGVVLLAAAGAAVLLTRRRRAAQRAAAYGKGSSHQTDSTSTASAKPDNTPSGATRSSDIFMGLEAGVAPPEWTEKHEQEAAADFATGAGGEDAADSCWHGAPIATLEATGRVAHTDREPGPARHTDTAGGAAPATAHTSSRFSRSNTGGLKPAFAMATKWDPDQTAAALGNTTLMSSIAESGGAAGGTPACVAASLVSAGSCSVGHQAGNAGAVASGGNANQAAQEQERQSVTIAANSTKGATAHSSACGAAGRPDEGGVTVQPAEAPRPTDVAAELARMAREVRMQVKDVAIRIDTVLGTGAFGVVYGGIWQGIPVAVKTVVISASAERRKRALQEAALCQSIVHPNIIATYACELQPIGAPIASVASSEAATTDSGRTGLVSMMPQIVDWRLYIIQELADGGPLSKLYGSPDIWPAPSAPKMVPVVALGLGIARAVAHLHSKRIIHGDLSPNNVMLKKDVAEPSGFAAKVGDFGLSVMLPQNQSHLSNLRMGTMFYMCPGVILKGQVGPASDVFSLGVILWELFHGRRAGVMTREGPRYASIFPAFPPSCPQLFVSVALNCLQKQPANRPSAETVAQHLEALLQSLMTTQGAWSSYEAALYSANARY